MDWDDPQARFHLAETVGIKRYNELLLEHVRKDAVAIVNGYAILPHTTRFGRVYQVVGTRDGFTSQQLAEDHARSLPKGGLTQEGEKGNV